MAVSATGPRFVVFTDAQDAQSGQSVGRIMKGAGMPATAEHDVDFDQATVVTILFTDLVASTETMDRIGDDRAESLRRAHFRLVRDAAASHGGRTVKSLGDGLMIVFASAVQAV